MNVSAVPSGFMFNWCSHFVSRAQSLLGTELRDASHFNGQRPS
jgi:hypothetical protein